MRKPSYFVLGDVHGCASTLNHLLWNILKIEAGDTIVFLGDLVDRGPDTKSVLDELFLIKKKGIHVIFIRGNHEEIMLAAFESKIKHDYWCRVGGKEVLDSFSVDSIMDIPDEYIDLIDESINYYEFNDFIFVHAGLNFERNNPFDDEHAMRWIRNMPLSDPWLKSRKLIHGHTPEPIDKIIYNQNPIINLDGGCVYADQENLGFLVAYEINSKLYYYTRNCE
jgi:serine/threonine protein phosphatase 1